jgi:hypothetical protein
VPPPNRRALRLYGADGVVHFFTRQTVEHVTEGHALLELEQFEHGPLPRRLFLVTRRKARSDRRYLELSPSELS